MKLISKKNAEYNEIDIDYKMIVIWVRRKYITLYTLAHFNRQVESCVNLMKIDLSNYKYSQD